MIPNDDWRRMGQEKYLMDVKLHYVTLYKPFSEQWEHEHCCFCTQKISFTECDSHSGYCTIDEKHSHWICEECFNDFKDEFNWMVIN